MDAPNPYEPPQPVIEGAAITDRFPSIVIFYAKNDKEIVAANSEGEELFIFRRPMSLFRDFLAALAFIGVFLISSVPLISVTLLITRLYKFSEGPALIAMAIAIWVSILAFYYVSPRFQFSAFATNAPRVRLYSICYHFFGFYRILNATNRDSLEVAKIRLRGTNLEAVLNQGSFPAIHLTKLGESDFSLTAITPQTSDPANPITQPLGSAQFLGKQLCFRSQIPPSMPMDQKLLVFSLLVLALESPAKSHMFLR